MDKQPCVYLLASKRNGTRNAGVNSDLITRVWERREHLVDGFTKKHHVGTLVWFELHETMESRLENPNDRVD